MTCCLTPNALQSMSVEIPSWPIRLVQAVGLHKLSAGDAQLPRPACCCGAQPCRLSHICTASRRCLYYTITPQSLSQPLWLLTRTQKKARQALTERSGAFTRTGHCTGHLWHTPVASMMGAPMCHGHTSSMLVASHSPAQLSVYCCMATPAV